MALNVFPFLRFLQCYKKNKLLHKSWSVMANLKKVVFFVLFCCSSVWFCPKGKRNKNGFFLLFKSTLVEEAQTKKNKVFVLNLGFCGSEFSLFFFRWSFPTFFLFDTKFFGLCCWACVVGFPPKPTLIWEFSTNWKLNFTAKIGSIYFRNENVEKSEEKAIPVWRP